MRENKLLIHIESGNVYFDNFNTNESIYDFLLWKQDFEKKLTNGDFSYGGVFSRYINEFLSGIDSEADNRFDLLTKKDAKYIFYCFSDYLQSWIFKINKNKRYKYLKILLRLKKFKKGTNTELKIIKKKKKMKNHYKIYMRVYNSTYRSVAKNFKEHILSLNIDETD